MPKDTNKLSDMQLRNLKPGPSPRKISDGGGLHILLSTTGKRLWRMSYRFGSKQQTMALGTWPQVSLGQARKLRDRIKEAVVLGEDPRKESPARTAHDTFRAVGDRWHARGVDEGTWGDETATRIRNWLENDLYPDLGRLPVDEIEAPALLEVFRKIEQRGVRETAHRLRGYCGSIFRFGIVEGLCRRDPAADIRDALRKKPRIQHRARLSASQLPGFLRKLDTCPMEDKTRDALLLTLLTVSRTDETRFAHADEFEGLDGAEPLWRLSPARMKMGREHLVPLSRQAVSVVRRLVERVDRSGLLFEADTRSGVISENTMLYELYRLGYHSKATVHGFRGTFSTIANECEDPDWNSDWIEMALAHSEDDDTRGAYNSALYLPQRRRLLQWWADYLDEARVKR